MNAGRQQGFTLIEMVIAFAILGMTLTVLYGVFENTLSRIRHDAHVSEATLLAQSLLARAGSEWPLADGTRGGGSDGYAYTLIETTVLPGEGQPPYTLPTVHITASVNWVEGGATHTMSLSTLKLATPVP
jgi:general secretion pathway protein I